MKSQPRRNLPLLLILCLLLAAVPAHAGESAEPKTIGAFSAINLNDENGQEADEPLTDACFADAELTMLNFWATWCGPCVGELPELARIAEATEGRVQVVGVLLDGASELGVRNDGVIDGMYTLLEDAGVAYPVVLPDEILMLLSRDMQYVPTTLFVNADGEVVDEVVGANTLDDWLEIIQELLYGMSDEPTFG